METTPRRKAASEPKPVETHVDLRTPSASTSPAMPHERDEGTGMTGGEPNERVRQGQRDLKHGLQDTSGAPEADAAYRKLKK